MATDTSDTPTMVESVGPDIEETSHLGTGAESVGTDWIPRNPQRYTTTGHFEDRAASRDRVIDHDLAAEIITRCDEPVVSGSMWHFHAETQGLFVFVYCTLVSDFVPAVNTGYAKVTDMETAKSSDRWTERQVLCEHVRNTLHKEEAPWPDEIADLDWEHPISVHGHPLVTEPGETTLYCTSCDDEPESWDELVTVNHRTGGESGADDDSTDG